MRPLLPKDEILSRLQEIFPRAVFDAAASNPLAASAVAAMLYVDAVVPDEGDLPADAKWVRPTTCLWMNEQVYARGTEADRASWLVAAISGRRHVEALQTSWGLADARPWYDNNTREPLRDETFAQWLQYGAARDKPGVKTTSGVARWALTESFADLFAPGLTGGVLSSAIDAWRSAHLNPGQRLRVSTHRDRERADYSVEVAIPGGEIRKLEPGDASLILKGVIEQWAPARLRDPIVLSISEPGAKVYLADDARLRGMGLSIDPTSLLPDALIADIGPVSPTFWVIEAVATDGPITEERKDQLVRWAEEQRIDVAACRFLSAFLDRNQAAARRRLKDLAVGTFAWYLSEPTRELSWREIGAAADAD